MSRISRILFPDEYRNGRLWNGYDYDRQAWVIEGKYVRCGHPDSMECHCYGKIHEGEECGQAILPEVCIKKSAGICNSCGEQGIDIQAWMPGSPKSQTSNTFYCPACGQ